MRTADIPGGKATFKTKEDLRGRDSKLVKAAVLSAQSIIEKLGDEAGVQKGETREAAAKRLGAYLREKKITFTQDEALSFLSLQEAVAVAYLNDWTLDIPKPTLETIGDLPDTVYEGLLEAVSGEMLDVSAGTDFSPNPDQSSPTGPSSASNGDLRAESSPEIRPAVETTNSSSAIEASPTERSIPA